MGYLGVIDKEPYLIIPNLILFIVLSIGQIGILFFVGQAIVYTTNVEGNIYNIIWIILSVIVLILLIISVYYIVFCIITIILCITINKIKTFENSTNKNNN